jgi:DNA (cytosine-5)-methyltransferase 1
VTPSIAAEEASSRDRARARFCEGKTFAEFFAGIGLVAEALRGTGWRCIYANDIDPRKHKMHADRNGDSPEYHLGDVRDADEATARLNPRPFLATASFPCVDLSTAGRYRGLEGDQSSTFFGFVEVLRRLGPERPRVVMLENVVGFLTSRGGADFAAAAEALASLGYRLDAFVLDARWFLPQSRPRVFVVGMADGVAPPRRDANTRNQGLDLFGGSESDGDGSGGPAPGPLRPAALRRAIQHAAAAAEWLHFDLGSPSPRGIELAQVIDLDDAQEWWDDAQRDRHVAMMSEAHRTALEQIARTGGPSFVATVFRRVRREGQRAEVRFDGLAGCLRTPRGGSGRQIVVAVVQGRIKMRWMSPREYARLQGVPDFPLNRPTSQLLFGFADAVCVPAVAWIDQNVLTPLYEATLAAKGDQGKLEVGVAASCPTT